MIYKGTEKMLLKRWEQDYKTRQWEHFHARIPVKDIYGKWHWNEHMYRLCGNTYVDQDDWTWYFYLTEHDHSWFILRWS